MRSPARQADSAAETVVCCHDNFGFKGQGYYIFSLISYFLVWLVFVVLFIGCKGRFGIITSVFTSYQVSCYMPRFVCEVFDFLSRRL